MIESMSVINGKELIEDDDDERKHKKRSKMQI